MPTVITHAVVGAGLFLAVGHGRPGARVGGCTAAALAMLPDIDRLFMRRFAFEATWGHRGGTHSVAFAAIAGLVAALAVRRRVTVPGGAWGLAVLFALVIGSHGLLDAMTDGGDGVAFLAPFLNDRCFLPWRPIPASPLILHPLLFDVLAIEAWMLWPAAIALATLRAKLQLPWRIVIAAALALSVVPWVLPMGLRPA